MLEVLRDGDTQKLEFVLVAPPEEPPRDRQLISRGPLAGMAVGNLSPALAQEMGMSVVDGASSQWRSAAGLPRTGCGSGPRDIIVSMNGKEGGKRRAIWCA